MTKGTLIQYDEQIRQWAQTGNILYIFNQSKINAFYQEFAIRLETINKELDKIRRKYLVHDSEGNPKIELLNNVPTPVYLNGVKAEDFLKEVSDFMKMEISNIKLSKAN